MPEGEKKHLNVERIVCLLAEGKSSLVVAKKLLKEIGDPETKWGGAVYVQVSASGGTGTSPEAQEAACARRYLETRGGANA